jgi:AcrR family transcriptional regulator
MIDTKERILESAERLFAENGYLATSLRRIMNEAGVNVASVHYYFRSKESLLEAVLLRRAERVNRERLEMLERLERESGGRTPCVEQVIEAFLVPTLRLAANPSTGGHQFLRLMGRLHAESDLLPGIILVQFRPVLLRFAEALAHALPEVPSPELFFRARLALGATAQVFRDSSYLKWADDEGEDEFDWHPVLARLVSFLSAGFRAPAMEMVRQQEIQ